ncbi:hypothetical protein FOZ62_028189, partial [Perkinsus olseni]
MNVITSGNTVVRGEVRMISLADEYDGSITLMMAAEDKQEKKEGDIPSSMPCYHHHVLASTNNKRTERWVRMDKLGIIPPTSSPVDGGGGGGGGGVGNDTLPDEHYVNDLVEEANITHRFSRTYPSPYRGFWLTDEGNHDTRTGWRRGGGGGGGYCPHYHAIYGMASMGDGVVGTSSPPSSWCRAYLHHACQEVELEVNKITIECELAKVNADHGEEEQGRYGIMLSSDTPTRAVTALPALDSHYDVTSLYDDIDDDDDHLDDDGTIGGKVYRLHTTEGERTLSTRATATAGVEEQQRQQSMMLSTTTTAAGAGAAEAALLKACTHDNFQRGTDHDTSVTPTTHGVQQPLDPSPDPTRDEEKEEVHSTTNPTTPAAVGADFSIVGKWRSQYANNIEVKEDGMVTMTILGREIRATILKEEVRRDDDERLMMMMILRMGEWRSEPIATTQPPLQDDEQQQEQQGLLLDDSPHIVTPDDNTVIPSSSNDNHHHEDGLTSSLLGHGDDGLTRPARPRTRPFASSLEMIFHTQNTQWPPPSQENDDVASDVTEMERDAPLSSSSSSSSQRQYDDDDDDVWTPPSNWNRALDELDALDGILTSDANDLGYVVHISQLLMDILQQHYYYHSNVNEHDNSAITRNNKEVVHIDKTMVLVVEGDDRVSDPTGEMPAILPTRIREHTTTTRRPVIIIHYANIVIKDSSHIILVIDMDA